MILLIIGFVKKLVQLLPVFTKKEKVMIVNKEFLDPNTPQGEEQPVYLIYLQGFPRPVQISKEIFDITIVGQMVEVTYTSFDKRVSKVRYLNS